jgi:phosphoribosylamine--glycine ligase
MIGARFGEAGRRLVIEECLTGSECSLHALVDGTNFRMLASARDHKRAFDGDAGPNTGGMGAFSPADNFSAEEQTLFEADVMQPLLDGLGETGVLFRGLLFPGLMMTEEGPRVLEFNCRFGDPETQTLMTLMDSSLLELIAAVAGGGSLSQARYPDWKPLASVTTVVAAAGYPDKPRTGDVIQLPPAEKDVEVFHAGTARDPSTNQLVTAGGRILSVTATAETLHEAAELSRSHAEQITFNGKQLRRDIGWRELTRGARVT